MKKQCDTTGRTFECLTKNAEGKEEPVLVRVVDGDQEERRCYETYESFVDKLAEDICSIGYGEKDLELRHENYRDVLDLKAHVNGRKTVFRFYPEDLYKQIFAEGYTNTVQKLLDQIRDTENDMKEADFSSIPLSGSFEELRDRLIIRPLNFTKYAAKLNNGIFHRHGDVALVLYLLLASQGGTLMTRMIEKSELAKWNMTDQKEEIFAEALERTGRLYPATVISEKYPDGIDLVNGKYRKEDVFTPRGIQLSSSIGSNGAAALFYPGVSAKLAELMNGKFAAVFLNTTDVMIMKPDSPYLKGYMEFASHENSFGEMLSGRKYLFDRKGQLMNA